jgi:hypothetical protein
VYKFRKKQLGSRRLKNIEILKAFRVAAAGVCGVPTTVAPWILFRFAIMRMVTALRPMVYYLATKQATQKDYCYAADNHFPFESTQRAATTSRQYCGQWRERTLRDIPKCVPLTGTLLAMVRPPSSQIPRSWRICDVMRWRRRNPSNPHQNIRDRLGNSSHAQSLPLELFGERATSSRSFNVVER